MNEEVLKDDIKMDMRYLKTNYKGKANENRMIYHFMQ